MATAAAVAAPSMVSLRLPALVSLAALAFPAVAVSHMALGMLLGTTGPG